LKSKRGIKKEFSSRSFGEYVDIFGVWKLGGRAIIKEVLRKERNLECRAFRSADKNVG